MTKIILPDLEATGASQWTYLVERPHAWKKQLYVKGRRLTAAQVWLDLQTNQMTESEAAENWDLPLEAISEISVYCRSNTALLQMEADEEKLYLSSQGIRLSA